MDIDKKDQVMISDTLVDDVFASIVDTAAREGVERRLLLARLHDRLQTELKHSEEPSTKKQKLTEEPDEKSTSLQENAMDIFLLSGLKFLPNEFLFPSFSLLSSTCQHAAKRELVIHCKDRHPSLFAAVNPEDNQEALLSWRQCVNLSWTKPLRDISLFGPPKCQTSPQILKSCSK